MHLQVTANGKCVVVETQDAGPASWVESDAGIANPQRGSPGGAVPLRHDVARVERHQDNPGKYVVQVSDDSAPLGPCGGIADASTPEGGSARAAEGWKGRPRRGEAAPSSSWRRRRATRRGARRRTVEDGPLLLARVGGGRAARGPLGRGRRPRRAADYSVGETPLARAGLDVVPLEADTPYRVVVSRDDGAVTATLLRADGDVVLRATVREGYPASAPDAVADVVVPGGDFRSCVVSMGL